VIDGISLEQLASALESAGMPKVPEEFSVVPVHVQIPRAIIADIGRFIDVFERVTTAAPWQDGVTVTAPAIAQLKRPEVCFFSAWDFHLPPEQPERWQLIEFNDNGSGFLFAALINDVFYRLARLERDGTLERPLLFAEFVERLFVAIEGEARRFFGEFPSGLFLILDDAESLRAGKFQHELRLLQELFRRRGWEAQVGAPADTAWDGSSLRWRGREVSFIVNRSTDFLWQGEACAALRKAYRDGHLYVAPNPFTYVTRSDKRLLELLSEPLRDEELGIRPHERAILSAHVPETHLLREENLEEIARRKDEFFFKPLYGFGGRGVLTSALVGRSRLRRSLKKGQTYVVQRKAPKSVLVLPKGDARLWTDLRVWAYRGERLLISSRASRDPDLLDLRSPGGWLPTYIGV
jgi:hypothetical protein